MDLAPLPLPRLYIGVCWLNTQLYQRIVTAMVLLYTPRCVNMWYSRLPIHVNVPHGANFLLSNKCCISFHSRWGSAAVTFALREGHRWRLRAKIKSHLVLVEE